MNIYNILNSYNLEVSLLIGNPTGESTEEIQKEHAILSSIKGLWKERASTLISLATYGDQETSRYKEAKAQFHSYCDSLDPPHVDKTILKRLVSWSKRIPSHQDWIIRHLSDPIKDRITALESNPDLPIPASDELIKELTSPFKESHCPLSVEEATLLKDAIEIHAGVAWRYLQNERSSITLTHTHAPIHAEAPVLKWGITVSVDSCPDEHYLAPLDAMRCRQPKEGHLLDEQGERITLFVQETLDRFCRAMLRTKTLCTKEELKELIKGEVRTYYPQSGSIEMAEWTLLTSLPGSRSLLHERLAAVAEQLRGIRPS